MVPVWSVLFWFQRMLDERWAYAWSGAEHGLVSCAGAWVYIFRQWNLSLYHGSNTIWRKHTGRNGKLGEVTPLPGWAVFKWRKDGEPEQYEKDGLDDFYHMGCFVGPTALHPEGAVIEAKGVNWGVVETSIRDGWSHGAEMLGVDYNATVQPQVVTGTIVAESGTTVNMRKAANGDAVVLLRAPLGTKAEILDIANGWAHIRVGNQAGYMLERFINIDILPGVAAPPASVKEESNESTCCYTMTVQEIEHIVAMIEQQKAALLSADRQLTAVLELLGEWVDIAG